MSPLHKAFKDSQWISLHLLFGAAILLLVILVSWIDNSPVRSIFPYAISVGLVAWKHGLTGGFVFAGFATLAALATGAFPSRDELSGHETDEGLYTYMKLSAVAVGVGLGKRARNRSR